MAHFTCLVFSSTKLKADNLIAQKKLASSYEFKGSFKSGDHYQIPDMFITEDGTVVARDALLWAGFENYSELFATVLQIESSISTSSFLYNCHI